MTDQSPDRFAPYDKNIRKKSYTIKKRKNSIYMISNRNLCILFIFLILAFYLFLGDVPAIDSENPHPTEIFSEQHTQSVINVTPSYKSHVSEVEPYCEVINGNPLKDNLAYISAIDLSIKNALSNNVDAIFSSSITSDILASFTISAKCSGQSDAYDLSFAEMDTLLLVDKNFCASLSDGYKVNPFSALELRLEHLHADGLLIAAKNALVYAKISSYEDSNSKEAAQYFKLAEDIGAMSAKRGSREAYKFMAENYITGKFGKVNLESAYFYLVGVNSSTPDTTTREAQRYVYNEMRKDQYESTDYKVRNCKKHTNGFSDEKLINPFAIK